MEWIQNMRSDLLRSTLTMWKESRLMVVDGSCIVGSLTSGEQSRQCDVPDKEVVIGVGSVMQHDSREQAIIVIMPDGKMGWFYRREVREV
jgi:hypothetical protein